MGFTFPRPAVFGFFTRGPGIPAVLDVNVHHVFAHGSPEIKGVLPNIRRCRAAVDLEHGIAGVEDQLETGDFVDQTKGVGGGKSTPVHAVFMRGGDSGIGETADNLAQPTETFLFVLILSPWFLGVGHDAHEFRAESLHARNGALDFRPGDFEVAGDLLRPTADQ